MTDSVRLFSSSLLVGLIEKGRYCCRSPWMIVCRRDAVVEKGVYIIRGYSE